MHEMSIAVEVVRRVIEAAREHRMTRVERVEVEVGVMRQVVPEALQLAFESAVEGTLAEGARLSVREERVVAVCRACECLFLPEVDTYVCPRCDQADARIVAGNDMILRSVEGRVDEEVGVS